MSELERPQFISDAVPKETEQEKRAMVISRLIETTLLETDKSSSGEDEKEIRIGLEGMSVGEKAIRLYENFIAATLTRTEKKGNDEPLNPYLVRELRILWSDEEVRRAFLDKFTEARVEAKKFRLADLVKRWRDVEEDIVRLKEERAILRQELRLKTLEEKDDIKAAKSKLFNTKKVLDRLLADREKIIKLETYEHTRENTDVAATIMYETLQRYHEEAKEGFAWVPSRDELHAKILDVVDYTGKAPLLVGPPGTGKTTQIDAVARELTGESAIRIPCSSGLGEEGIVANRDVKAGEGSYDYKGCIAEAFTGFEHSTDTEPHVSHGRVANLDEISQLNLERAMAVIKDIRQAKEGKKLSRYVPHEVLPGSLLTATSNLPISDERLEREFGRIPTDYFKMSKDNPELYEFLIAKLLRDEGHIPAIDVKDLAPAYERKTVPDDKQKVLADKSIVVATDELVQDQADPRHGFLYRLAYAIRAIQDSYIHGSKFNEKHLANTAFYEDSDDKGKIVIKEKGYISDLKGEGLTSASGGEMLKLKSGSSTLTVEIISKWVEGFVVSGEQDFPKWIQRMLQDHINQTAHDDGERIRAILDYFHLFDASSKTGEAKPLTPKEIGYLSPRVPRPVYVEQPKPVSPEAPPEPEKPGSNIVKPLTTKQVVLENGKTVLVNVRPYKFKHFK